MLEVQIVETVTRLVTRKWYNTARAPFKQSCPES